MLCGNYLKAERYLNEGLIRPTVPDIPNKLTRREWMHRFLVDLGHPEQFYPTIHIAGTSGKGSTAIMIAEILRSAGYRVGLHTTPYLQVATEKLWVDGKYASAEEFVNLVEWIRPICERWRGPEVPLHGMASFGICLEYFKRKKIDIAVMECGVGGREDITNVLKTRLSVITPIGLDHTVTLGDTIDKIARHKSGIIKSRVPVVAFKGDGEEIIADESRRLGSPLSWVNPSESHGNPAPSMLGNFQNINALIAKRVSEVLKRLGFEIGEKNINAGISNACLPGRMEILQNNPDVIIDGAHNYQKLKTLLEEFTDQKPTVVFGILRSKINEDIIDLLKKSRLPVIITTPRVYGKEGLDPESIVSKLKDATIVQNIEEALAHALNKTPRNGLALATGSLYLAGNIRNLYYPPEKVLESRTSWLENMKKGSLFETPLITD